MDAGERPPRSSALRGRAGETISCPAAGHRGHAQPPAPATPAPRAPPSRTPPTIGSKGSWSHDGLRDDPRNPACSCISPSALFARLLGDPMVGTGGVRLGVALGAGAAGAGGCACPLWPAAGPLIISPARPRRALLRGGRSPASTGNPATQDTCTGRASKWARRVRGRRRLCHRGREAAFVPGACGAAAWQASDSRRGRELRT